MAQSGVVDLLTTDDVVDQVTQAAQVAAIEDEIEPPAPAPQLRLIQHRTRSAEPAATSPEQVAEEERRVEAWKNELVDPLEVVHTGSAYTAPPQEETTEDSEAAQDLALAEPEVPPEAAAEPVLDATQRKFVLWPWSKKNTPEGGPEPQTDSTPEQVEAVRPEPIDEAPPIPLLVEEPEPAAEPPVQPGSVPQSEQVEQATTQAPDEPPIDIPVPVAVERTSEPVTTAPTVSAVALEESAGEGAPPGEAERPVRRRWLRRGTQRDAHPPVPQPTPVAEAPPVPEPTPVAEAPPVPESALKMRLNLSLVPTPVVEAPPVPESTPGPPIAVPAADLAASSDGGRSDLQDPEVSTVRAGAWKLLPAWPKRRAEAPGSDGVSEPDVAALDPAPMAPASSMVRQPDERVPAPKPPRRRETAPATDPGPPARERPAARVAASPPTVRRKPATGSRPAPAPPVAGPVPAARPAGEAPPVARGVAARAPAAGEAGDSMVVVMPSKVPCSKCGGPSERGLCEACLEAIRELRELSLGFMDQE